VSMVMVGGAAAVATTIGMPINEPSTHRRVMRDSIAHLAAGAGGSPGNRLGRVMCRATPT
jgi:hypothetical protein